MTWTGGPPTGPCFLEALLARETEAAVESAAVAPDVGVELADAAAVVGGPGRDDASTSLRHEFSSQSP